MTWSWHCAFRQILAIPPPSRPVFSTHRPRPVAAGMVCAWRTGSASWRDGKRARSAYQFSSSTASGWQRNVGAFRYQHHPEVLRWQRVRPRKRSSTRSSSITRSNIRSGLRTAAIPAAGTRRTESAPRRRPRLRRGSLDRYETFESSEGHGRAPTEGTDRVLQVSRAGGAALSRNEQTFRSG